jgi:hypothetical protein
MLNQFHVGLSESKNHRHIDLWFLISYLCGIRVWPRKLIEEIGW